MFILLNLEYDPRHVALCVAVDGFKITVIISVVKKVDRR